MWPVLQTLFNLVSAILTRSTIPDYRGTADLRGLREEVRISFDSYGVPHIVARNEADLFFAQGYVHAQDRLFQMDLMRLAGSGRLAETIGDEPLRRSPDDTSARLIGKRTADLDYFVRILGLRRTAEASLDIIDERSRETLQAYAEGVNRFIESCARRLPIEFRLLGVRPESWNPVDSLLVLKLATHRLTGDRKAAMALYRELRRHPERFPDGKEQLLDIIAGGRTNEPAESARRLVWEGVEEVHAMDGALRNFIGWTRSQRGSTAWAINGALSRTGRPVLCCDLRSPLRAPGSWYLAHLAGGEYNVHGGSIPGSPGILVGRNQRIAWGMTGAPVHDCDLFIERLNPGNPEEYAATGGWRRFEVCKEVIAIRGKPAELRAVRSTRHGPVVSDILEPTLGASSDASKDGPEPVPLSLRWVGCEPSAEVQAVLAINRAFNFEEFHRAAAFFHSPAQEMVFADVDGNIGRQLAGRLPIQRGQPSMLPVPGWDDGHEWLAWIPFEELPFEKNPDERFIVAADGATADEPHPGRVFSWQEASFRIRRIRQVLESRPRHSAEDMRNLQLDVLSIPAHELIQSVIAPLAARARTWEEDAKWAIGQLLEWNGDCGAESLPAVIFHTFYYELLRELFPDQAFDGFLEEAFLSPARDRLVDAGHERAVRRALLRSVAWLRAVIGPDPERWRWAALHTLTMNHPLGVRKIARRFFNIGPVETPGSNDTVNGGPFCFASSFRHLEGAGFRMIVDLAEPNRSSIVTATGQSGIPACRHYRDQVPLWLEGEYLPMTTDPAEGGQDRVLRLRPAGEDRSGQPEKP